KSAGTGRSPAAESRIWQRHNAVGWPDVVDLCLATPGIVRRGVSRRSDDARAFPSRGAPPGIVDRRWTECPPRHTGRALLAVAGVAGTGRGSRVFEDGANLLRAGRPHVPFRTAAIV